MDISKHVCNKECLLINNILWNFYSVFSVSLFFSHFFLVKLMFFDVDTQPLLLPRWPKDVPLRCFRSLLTLCAHHLIWFVCPLSQCIEYLCMVNEVCTEYYPTFSTFSPTFFPILTNLYSTPPSSVFSPIHSTRLWYSHHETAAPNRLSCKSFCQSLGAATMPLG